jgi:hypothetical protein
LATAGRPAYAAGELAVDQRGLKPDVRLSADLRRRAAMHAAHVPTAYRPTPARLPVASPSTAATRFVAIGELSHVALMRADKAGNRLFEVRHGRKVDL